MTGSWLTLAACAEIGPALFFSDGAAKQRQARAICADCPVQQECLDAAIAEERVAGYEPHGIRGGLLAKDRRRPTVVRVCRGCGTLFEAPSSRAWALCSEGCRVESRRRVRRASVVRRSA